MNIISIGNLMIFTLETLFKRKSNFNFHRVLKKKYKKNKKCCFVHYEEKMKMKKTVILLGGNVVAGLLPALS